MKRRSPESRGDFSTDLHRFMKEGATGEICNPIAIPELLGERFEIDFCKSILSRDAKNAEVLAFLGESYAKQGDYAKGLAADLALSKLKPVCGTVQYNLACAFALLGRHEKALSSLEKALEYGFSDVEHLRKDKDLACLQKHPLFHAILVKMAKRNKKRDQATSL